MSCFSASNLTGLALLHFLFRERYAGIIDEQPVAGDPDDETNSTTPTDETSSTKSANSSPPSTQPELPPFDLLAVSLCYATRFVDM